MNNILNTNKTSKKKKKTSKVIVRIELRIRHWQIHCLVRRVCPLSQRHPSSPSVLVWLRSEGILWGPFYKSIILIHESSALLLSCPNYLLKAPPTGTNTLGIRFAM